MEEEQIEMTIAEAIEVMKDRRFWSPQKYGPAFDMAIDVLSRAKPIFPHVYGDGTADGRPVYDMWECPNCGTEYDYERRNHNYCPYCGQAILWAK